MKRKESEKRVECVTQRGSSLDWSPHHTPRAQTARSCRPPWNTCRDSCMCFLGNCWPSRQWSVQNTLLVQQPTVKVQRTLKRMTFWHIVVWLHELGQWKILCCWHVGVPYRCCRSPLTTLCESITPDAPWDNCVTPALHLLIAHFGYIWVHLMSTLSWQQLKDSLVLVVEQHWQGKAFTVW